MNQEPHEWLVIFLVHANLLLDIENQHTTGYIPVQVQKDTLFHSLDDYRSEKNIKIIIIESRFELDDDQIVHRKFIMQNTGKGIVPYEADIAGIDIQNGESVKHLFNEIMQKEKAKRRMVVTWGHGSIFGIFLTDNTMQLLRKDIPALREGHPMIPPFESPGQIYLKSLDLSWLINLYKDARYDIDAYKKLRSSFDVLTNAELATSIGGLVGRNEKINIVIMDNCLMQNVATQSDLKNVVHYLVAPESGISYPGFNYDKILIALNSDPFPEAEEVVNVIMTSLKSHRKFKNYPQLLNELEKTWAIHAKDLNNFHLFEEKFTAFITAILDHPEASTVIRYLKDALGECFPYNKYSLPRNTVVDLKVVLFFFNELISTIERFQNLKDLAADCITAIDSITGTMMLGQKLYKDNTYRFNDNKLPNLVSGLGILFPFNRNEIDSRRIEFLKDPDIRPSFFTNTKFLDLLQEMRILNIHAI